MKNSIKILLGAMVLGASLLAGCEDSTDKQTKGATEPVQNVKMPEQNQAPMPSTTTGTSTNTEEKTNQTMGQ